VAVGVLSVVFVAGGIYSATAVANESPNDASVRFRPAVGGLIQAISWAAVAAHTGGAVVAGVLFFVVWRRGTKRAPLYVPLSVRFARRGEPAIAVGRLTPLLNSYDDATAAAAAESLGTIGLPASVSLKELHEIASRDRPEAWLNGVRYDLPLASFYARAAIDRIIKLEAENPITKLEAENLLAIRRRAYWLGTPGIYDLDE